MIKKEWVNTIKPKRPGARVKTGGGEDWEGLLTGFLDRDEEAVYAGLGGNADVIRRRLLINYVPAVLIYIEGITDQGVIHDDVLSKLQSVGEVVINQADLLDFVALKILSAGSVRKSTTFPDMLAEVLLGNSLLIIDGLKEGLIIATKGGDKRAIMEPLAEFSLRGPREGFVEDVSVNMALIRRRIVSPDLVMEAMTIGERSRTRVIITYLSDIADPKIVQEVRHRLGHIKTDAVLALGTIEKFIEDNPYSLFPQVMTTMKPDRVIGNILEGRVAVLADGIPFALVVPAVFIQFLQGVEDYYDRTIVGSAARLVRYISFIFTTTMTAIYIALITFHHSLLPADLLLSVIEARQMIPFNPLTEALLMELTIEILREAGLRLPSPIGQTLGVLGGIVIGQAVVMSHVVSPLVVLIVSLAALSSFVFPFYSMSLAIRLIKFPMMILAATFGALGIAAGWIIITIHLASMESFGVPYLAPLAPMRYADIGDTFTVSAIWKHKKRPASIPHLDDRRTGDDPQEHAKNEK